MVKPVSEIILLLSTSIPITLLNNFKSENILFDLYPSSNNTSCNLLCEKSQLIKLQFKNLTFNKSAELKLQSINSHSLKIQP